MDVDELRVLRRFVGGARTLPQRDAWIGARLREQGLIAESARSRTGACDLTDSGVQVLVDLDGPLTDAERREWLRWPHTRFGVDGDPQYLNRNSGWRRVHLPRMRKMILDWQTNGPRAAAW